MVNNFTNKYKWSKIGLKRAEERLRYDYSLIPLTLVDKSSKILVRFRTMGFKPYNTNALLRVKTRKLSRADVLIL